jgi:hypothetical protein
LPALTIPERYRKGIAAIGSLPQATFTNLLGALKVVGHAENAKLLAEQIRKTSSLPAKVPLEPILTALAAMQEVRRSGHVEPDRFASDVWAALREDSPELVQNIDEVGLKERIASLASGTDIHLTSIKVGLLRSEVERAFCGVRIMTDLRAAFSDDVSKVPPGLTILHTLLLRYHDDSARHREFYITLDDDDLKTLKEAIERAESKRKTLAAALAKADLKVFD